MFYPSPTPFHALGSVQYRPCVFTPSSRLEVRLPTPVPQAFPKNLQDDDQ